MRSNEHLKERDHFEDTDRSKEAGCEDVRMWTGFDWFWIGSSGGLLTKIPQMLIIS
jgi:hypothetical protein